MILFEQIFREASKARFINKLNISREEKDEWISFFDSPIGQQYSNEIDWNNPAEISLENFKKIKDLADNSISKKKKDQYNKISSNIKSNLANIRDLEFAYENDKWLFYRVLSYKAARFCNSIKCGGQGAKWCIGYEHSDSYWKNYILKDDKFILAIRKDRAEQDDLKYMIQLTDDPENDIEIDIYDYCENKGIDEKDLDKHIKEIIDYKKDIMDKVAVIWNQKDTKDEELVTGDYIWLAYFNIDIEKLRSICGIEFVHDPAVITSTEDIYKNNGSKVVLNPFLSSKDGKVINTQSYYNFPYNTMDIMEGIEYIEDKAFSQKNYSSLTVYLPTSVKDISAQAFHWCDKINVIISKNNPYLEIVNGYIYSKDNKSLRAVLNASSIKGDMLSSVESMANGVFSNYIMPDDVLKLSDNLKAISKRAFYGCHIKCVEIPKSVKIIDEKAFSHATTEIFYYGSSEDFKNIRKAYNWYDKDYGIVVICSEDDVTLEYGKMSRF